MTGAIIGLAFLIGFFGGWPTVAIGAAAACMFGLAGWWRATLVPLVLAALVIGAFRAPELGQPNSGWTESDVRVTGVVSSAVVDDGAAQWLTFRVDDISFCARIFARGDVGRGDRLEAEIRLNDTVLISEGYWRYVRSQGCDASATLGEVELVGTGHGLRRSIDRVRQTVTTKIISWVPGDRGALLAGLVIGDDVLLSPEASGAFARTGTIHVVAVSGSNLALIASILLITHAFVRRRAPLEALGMAIVWGYVLLAAAVPPTLRAGILATLAAGARQGGRPADVLTLSALVAAIQAAIWPESTLGLSYRLSTVAIFAVAIATAGRSFTGWLSGLRLVALTTVVVNIAMLPVLPSELRPVLVLSLMTNVAIAPLIAIAFTLGVMAVLTGWLIAPLGEAFAVVAGQINRLTLSVVQNIAGIGRLPSPLDFSGASLPPWALLCLAGAFLAAMSTDFRRWAGNLIQAPILVSEEAADVAVGAGFGVLCATVGIALVR